MNEFSHSNPALHPLQFVDKLRELAAAAGFVGDAEEHRGMNRYEDLPSFRPGKEFPAILHDGRFASQD